MLIVAKEAGAAAADMVVVDILFYRAMLRISQYCHGKSSVCLSVTLRYCGHMFWNSSKIITRIG